MDSSAGDLPTPDTVFKPLLDDTVSESSISSHYQSLVSSSETTPAARVRGIFRKARQLFINRQFSEAYAAIQPLVTQTSTLFATVNADSALHGQVWQLYLALLDSILSLPENEQKESFSKAEMSYIRELAVEFEIWTQARATCTSSRNIEPDLILALAALCIRHDANSEGVRVRVEDFIIVGGPLMPESKAFRKLLEFYVFFILPACSKWSDARHMIDSRIEFDAEAKVELHNRLDKLESSTIEAQKNKLKADVLSARKRELEKKRKAQAAAKASSKSEQSPADASTAQDADADGEQSPAGGAPAPKASRIRAITRLPDLWKTILRTSRQPAVLIRLLEYVMFLLALVLALGVSENRKKLGSMLLTFLGRAKNTLAMAVRVRYV
ncbi:hypothetical protein BZA70DRAFT_62776 [Myxozyma melibiosi]|uniref:Uncharacterized protein n=1 Tax=Myxozyma melibiosi TaxID=54550 RepID=A0ABR1F221_9ASCO